MRLNTTSTPFTAGLDLSNAHPYSRVSMNQVLAGNTHTATVKRVTPREMDALLAGNKIIDDTWRILNKGSGNQRRAVIATEGESFKRMMVARTEYDAGRDWGDIALTAARFQAGACGEMAAVSALLGAVSGIKQPVSILTSSMQDHTVAEIGDNRTRDRSVIVDAWPEFGRAMLREDYALLGNNPKVEDTYEPDNKAPRVRERLLYDHKASQADIDNAFVKQYPSYPKSGKKLADRILKDNAQYMFAQRHGAENLAVRYEGRESSGDTHTVDLNLTKDQFNRRLEQLGLDAKKGEPVSEKSGPGALRRLFGGGKNQTS
ncbi:MAG: hypothetical protein GAK32_01142 [Pseudomonas fluorescens]|nr:MAG: hypothetical protein GAK32_01142 [Pseudomonas fluorescens]